jgi:Asp-tRNA(Asn)/Glu-tRNA(Gln) amidotransferase A subunit family amidase
MSKLSELSATELAALIRMGDSSSREVVESHLERNEQVNQAGVQRPTAIDPVT